MQGSAIPTLLNKRRKIKRRLKQAAVVLILILIPASVIAQSVLQNPKQKPIENETKIVETLKNQIGWRPEPLVAFPRGEYVTRVDNKPVIVKKPIVNTSSTDVVALARQLNPFGEAEWPALYELIRRESGWNQYALNPSSGAGGLFQALPYSKVGCPMSDLNGQLAWGFSYIRARYISPSRALAWHNSHGWY